MKQILLFLLSCFVQLSFAQATPNVPSLSQDIQVEFQTTMGNFRVRLFRDTPIHSQHFAQLVKDYRGALAAARESDDVNPQRRSSATQFYVVWGKRWTPNDLANVREHVEEETGINDLITDNMALDYYTRGGSPHLDGQYTVFGEVVEGLDVIGKIQGVSTDRNDRPRIDVRILTARIIPTAPPQ